MVRVVSTAGIESAIKERSDSFENISIDVLPLKAVRRKEGIKPIRRRKKPRPRRKSA